MKTYLLPLGCSRRKRHNLLWFVSDWRTSHVVGADWQIKAGVMGLRLCLLALRLVNIKAFRVLAWSWKGDSMKKAPDLRRMMWRSSAEQTRLFVYGDSDVDYILIRHHQTTRAGFLVVRSVGLCECRNSPPSSWECLIDFCATKGVYLISFYAPPLQGCI